MNLSIIIQRNILEQQNAWRKIRSNYSVSMIFPQGIDNTSEQQIRLNRHLRQLGIEAGRQRAAAVESPL